MYLNMKMGRPSKNLLKHFAIRLNQEDFDLLTLLHQKTGLSKVDVIRQALRVLADQPGIYKLNK